MYGNFRALFPYAATAKNIRDDSDAWHQMEKYIGDHSEAQFSHGICPECYENVVKPELESTLNDGSSLRSRGSGPQTGP